MASVSFTQNLRRHVDCDSLEIEGRTVREVLDRLRDSHPQLAHYVVDERDTRGGSGASFVVEWRADQPVTAPVVEAVMISSGTQGVSFVGASRVIGQLGTE